MFIVNKRSSIPIYKQLSREIKDLILKEVIKEGEKLPSISELSTVLNINPINIHRAYKELLEENIVTSVSQEDFLVIGIGNEYKEEKILNLTKEIQKIILEAEYLDLNKVDLIDIVEKAFEELKGGG